MALHDVRFVEDDWESPTLGAWGLGWECWCDGMEVSQFTYFQQVAGFECAPVSGELTYGLERLAMYVQGVDSIYDINFNGRAGDEKISYGDVFLQAEQEYSRFNFEFADTELLFRHFKDAEGECRSLLDKGEADERHLMALPAYDQCIKASHAFNLLDARGVISVTERQSYILRVRELAKACGAAWLKTAGGGQPLLPPSGRRWREAPDEGSAPPASPHPSSLRDDTFSLKGRRGRQFAVEFRDPMPDLLLELFSEEIPARMQRQAADDLKRLVTNALVDGRRDLRGRAELRDAAPARAARRRPARGAAASARGAQGAARRRAGRRDPGLPEERGARLASRTRKSRRTPRRANSMSRSSSGPAAPTRDLLAEILPAIDPRFSLAEVDALGRGLERGPTRCAGCARCARSCARSASRTRRPRRSPSPSTASWRATRPTAIASWRRRRSRSAASRITPPRSPRPRSCSTPTGAST